MHACLLHRVCVCVSLLWLAFEVLDGRLMAVQEQDIIVPLDVGSEVAACSHGMTGGKPITTARVLKVFKLHCAPPLPPKHRDVVVTHTPSCSKRSQLPEWRRHMVEPVPKKCPGVLRGFLRRAGFPVKPLRVYAQEIILRNGQRVNVSLIMQIRCPWQL